MSYNPNPKWAKITYKTGIWGNCPECDADNWEQFGRELDEAMEGGYYNAPHIPETIHITCEVCECEYELHIIGEIFIHQHYKKE